MTTVPPPAPPEEPSNRWPWVALSLGVLIVVLATVFFFVNRSRSGVDITVEGSPTPNPVARAASPSPPPTLVPPVLATSVPSPPTSTPVPPTATPVPPTATPVPSPTPAPAATPVPPPPPTATPVSAPAAAPGVPASPVTAPPPAQPAQLAPPAGQPTLAATTQVSNPGGLGNTRADLDTAYGAPVGETPQHLVVYRKNTFEYHVGFVPDPSGRAALIVEQPQQSGQAFTVDQAMAEARTLLPRDAQPPTPQPEGNERFVVERFTSATLAQALPAAAFALGNGQPGQFLAVYQRDPQQPARITRLIVGPGNDPQALITAAGQ